MIPIPTRRFFALAVIAPVGVLIGKGAPGICALAVAYGEILLSLGILDAVLAARLPKLKLSREAPHQLHVKQQHQILWHVENRSAFALTLQLHDPPPRACIAEPEISKGRVPAHAVGTLTYKLTPQERGDAAFGAMTYRVQGPLGLSMVQRRLPAPQPVRILPTLANWTAGDLAQRKALARQSGSHRYRWRGAGTVFESLREYNVQDDIRWVDWKATSRMTRPISRNYETERHQQVVIMLDASRMMTTYCGHRTKFDAVLEAAVLTTQAVLDQQDHVGLLVFSDRIETYIHPAGHARQAGRVMTELYARFPRLTDANYEAAVTLVSSKVRRRSLILLFTDLTMPEPSSRMMAYLSRLKPVHLPLVVTISDDALIGLADSPPRIPDDMFRTGVANDLLNEREVLLQRLQRRGIHVLEALADQIAVQTVERYLMLKRRLLL